MELAKSETSPVARPLRVLVPLIRDDIEQGDNAAQNAAMPFYTAAGAKLNEARYSPGMSGAEFWDWATRNFKRGKQQLGYYMQLDTHHRAVERQPFKSIKDFRRRGLGHNIPTEGGGLRQPAWKEPVKEAIGKVNVAALKQDALAKQEERALQRKLALSLIDIGYKALATKLHPDKGGSREAMMRLNRVRELLKAAVT